MTPEIRVYFENYPLLQTQGNSFTIGFIDNTGALSIVAPNDSNLLIIIREPKDAILINNSRILFVATTQQNITLSLQIKYNGIQQIFSLVAVLPELKIDYQTILQRLINNLPPNLYNITANSNIYTELLASAKCISGLYKQKDNYQFRSLGTILNGLYPESGIPEWELFLTGNTKLLEQDTTQYNNLIEHIYSTNRIDNNNSYFVAWNISKYIYLWLNKQKYVYIGENLIDIEDSFILNFNELGKCYLTSTPNSHIYDVYIYVLNATDITTAEQTQITSYIRSIVRAGMRVIVDYTKSITDFSNNTFLGNTYFRDQRQEKSYCIAYNQGILEEALGYAIPVIQNKILDFSLEFDPQLPSQTTINANTIYNITINVTTQGVITLNKPYLYYLQIYNKGSSQVKLLFTGTNQTIDTNGLVSGNNIILKIWQNNQS